MTDAPNHPRLDYDTPELLAEMMDPDPIAQVRAWLAEAISAGVPQADAASLATVSPSGRPAVRTVLLKELDTGFVVYTNYNSRKGLHLTETPRAALGLTWVTLHRQIRIEGSVEKTSSAQSDAYFASRPRGAQIAAAVSNQSQHLESREELEARHAEMTEHAPGTVTRPPHWGGYRIIPDIVEFWQGRRNRMHDRIEYQRTEDGWQRHRLAP